MDKMEHQLPFEILQQVFSHLQKKSNLLQCQLACQQWYQVATEKLYESVTVNYEPRATAFIRAVTRSPDLGNLVKVVNVGWLFNRTINKKGSLFTWDTQDLLSLILNFCPNIMKIQAVSPDKTFWVRLVCAFVNGELQFLECIPNPDYDSIESYVHTALTFRQMLKELVLCDQIGYQSPTGKEIDFRSYEVLLRRLKDFPNLNKLKILHHTNNDSLLEFDSVIQDCPKLKTLDIAIYPLVHVDSTAESSNAITLNSFQPRPDIKDVSGIWEIMDSDNAIKYFMHKFPKLDKMAFRFGSRPDLRPAIPYDFSAEDMITFFKYVSNIPSLHVECAFKADGLIDIWAEYMEITNFQGGVGIDYGFRNTGGNRKMFLTKPPSCTGPDFTATLIFEAEDGITELPHTELIGKVGHLVQKLEISRIQDVQTYFETREGNEYMYDMVNGRWLDDILQKCPAVKDIALFQPGFIRLDNSTVKTNESVQKLFISNLFANENDTILTDLSTRLPALTHLHLYYYEEVNENVTTINMLHTHFDKLVWDKSTTVASIFREDWKFYLKVTAPTTGETFFMGDRNDIYPSSEEHYNDSLRDPELLSFDIRCKSIGVFWVKFRHVVDKKHNLNIN